jgi:hypothetical protein
VVTGIGKCGQLVAPRVPGFRKTVNHEHGWAKAAFCEVNANSVGGDAAVGNLRHWGSLAYLLAAHQNLVDKNVARQ